MFHGALPSKLLCQSHWAIKATLESLPLSQDCPLVRKDWLNKGTYFLIMIAEKVQDLCRDKNANIFESRKGSCHNRKNMSCSSSPFLASVWSLRTSHFQHKTSSGRTVQASPAIRKLPMVAENITRLVRRRPSLTTATIGRI